MVAIAMSGHHVMHVLLYVPVFLSHQMMLLLLFISSFD
jgi:hypothetical protein